MRRNLMIGLAVAMLCGVVFAATFVSQYATPGDSARSDLAEAGPVVPLSFATNQVYYSPADENVGRRHFAGFYETSSELVPAPFWFQNPHAEPVVVTVRDRSCTACTSARVAAVPAPRVERFANEALADLALGANSQPGLGLALASASLLQDMQWQQLDFDKPDQGATVPAAASPERPTWGVFMMEIKVGGVGPAERSVLIGEKLGSRPMITQSFSARVVGASPFSLDQTAINLGEMPEGAGVRRDYVVAWSSTRGFDRFPPPKAVVTAKDGFVQVGEPVAMTRAQMLQLEADSFAQKTPTRVQSGYRIPLEVYRRRPAGVPGEGPPEPEIGPFERTVQVAGPGGATASFKVSGTVTGVVTLQGATAIDLRDFNGKLGVTNESFTLLSERPGVTLQIDPETSPSYLKAELGEPQPFGPTRKRWELKVSVPPQACYGDLPPGAAVVLTGESNGEPFRLRLPVKGRGFRRGS